jgi:phosphosulfolactate phosphohydrolase-like enzyme
MLELAFVTPKSNKAKNRFANLMGSNPECIVEQIKGNRVFLRSTNGKNFFWVDLKNDAHWGLEF